MSNKPIRCAIYTRKSTEEGLDKEFNSLEAQREACESYIKSQMHEGWKLIPTVYDDGGYTGGNMDRPALQALMADIKAGKVDVIVVYKVDRLSRSLNDFAQMVNVFDAHQVSFVSITQQFNTTTSMGRLTLNILLSFAQFEREVIGERVRDKVAASKQKGMWMGGHPPLGYDIEHRKLVVNPQEALLVNEIFERYLEMESAYKLAEFLNARGDRNKRWVNRHGVESGGQPFLYQALYKILNNQLYIGRITHKDKSYEGQHQPIISVELWDRVQNALKAGQVQRERRYAKHGALLMGKCFSPAGYFYTPTYTTSGAVRHRYYIEKKTQHRIKAVELESLVTDTIRLLAREPKHWRACWTGNNNHLIEEEAQHRWEVLWSDWAHHSDLKRQQIARQMLDRVVVSKDQVTMRLSYAGMREVLDCVEAGSIDHRERPDDSYRPTIVQGAGYIEITIAARFELYGRSQIALDAEGKAIRTFKRSNYNPVLVNALVKSYRWNRQLESGQITITDLAKQERRDRTYIARVVNLMMLAPDIISSILIGTQPATMQLQHLTANLPIEWHRQKQILKFPVKAV